MPLLIDVGVVCVVCLALLLTCVDEMDDPQLHPWLEKPPTE